MFGVIVTWNAVMGAMTDPEVGADLLRLVHGEQDMRFLAPIRPGDKITSRAKIISIETRPSGETMAVELSAKNQNGAASAENRVRRLHSRRWPATPPPRPAR